MVTLEPDQRATTSARVVGEHSSPTLRLQHSSIAADQHLRYVWVGTAAEVVGSLPRMRTGLI